MQLKISLASPQTFSRSSKFSPSGIIHYIDCYEKVGNDQSWCWTVQIWFPDEEVERMLQQTYSLSQLNDPLGAVDYLYSLSWVWCLFHGGGPRLSCMIFYRSVHDTPSRIQILTLFVTFSIYRGKHPIITDHVAGKVFFSHACVIHSVDRGCLV